MVLKEKKVLPCNPVKEIKSSIDNHTLISPLNYYAKIYSELQWKYSLKPLKWQNSMKNIAYTYNYQKITRKAATITKQQQQQ